MSRLASVNWQRIDRVSVESLTSQLPVRYSTITAPILTLITVWESPLSVASVSLYKLLVAFEQRVPILVQLTCFYQRIGVLTRACTVQLINSSCV